MHILIWQLWFLLLISKLLWKKNNSLRRDKFGTNCRGRFPLFQIFHSDIPWERKNKNKKSREIVTITNLSGDKPLTLAMTCNGWTHYWFQRCYTRGIKQINEFLFSHRLFLKTPNENTKIFLHFLILDIIF